MIEIQNFVPLNGPTNMSGKINTRIRIKKDYKHKNGTCALFIDVSIDGKRRKLPLHIKVKPIYFSLKKQKILGNSQETNDFNLLIEKKLADINKIELNFRLSNKKLDIDTLFKELENPTPNYDFFKFYEFELLAQKKFLKSGTYRQQKSTLNKLINWKGRLAFSEITTKTINELKLYCKNVLNNSPSTISTTLKNFKKYLHIANKKGIYTQVKFDDIKVPVFKGCRTFLDDYEVKRLFQYFKNKYTNPTHKLVLAKFLFSSFTSLRISDIQKITQDNIISGELVYTSEKTSKINKIKLNNTAKILIQKEGDLFADNFTPEYINRQLKIICSMLGIRKKVTFHVARHTFATNFIAKGGNLVNLKNIMGHSNIRETMIYTHTVNRLKNTDIFLLDDMIN